MTLGEYFEQANGFGVLATTDAAGQINQAIYAKPYFLDKDDDGTCCFIMTQRLSHDNVWRNPSASYLFIEDGGQFVGKRLSLRVIAEETDIEKIKAVRSQYAPPWVEKRGQAHILENLQNINSLRNRSDDRLDWTFARKHRKAQSITER